MAARRPHFDESVLSTNQPQQPAADEMRANIQRPATVEQSSAGASAITTCTTILTILCCSNRAIALLSAMVLMK